MSGKKSTSLKERTAECMVCGKFFPRGMLDLARHTNAVTLKHLVSKRRTVNYCYSCSRCGLNFTSNDHLKMHNTQSSCKKNNGRVSIGGAIGWKATEIDRAGSEKRSSSSKASKSSKAASSRPDSGEVEEDLEAVAESDVDDSYEDTGGEDGHSDNDPDVGGNREGMEEGLSNEENADLGDLDNKNDRTLECMICGKLFPRGPIDLARHATAVTLKHGVSRKSTSSYRHGCVRCGLYFSSMEHLSMHSEQSTCNPNMVWPPNSHNTSGLRCISKQEYAAAEAAAAAEESVNIKRSNTGAGSAGTGAGAGSKKKDWHTYSSSSKHASNKKRSAAAAGLEDRKAGVSSQALKLGATVLGGPADVHNPRWKQASLIVPEDRKAFFAVISLLVDAAMVPSGVKLDERNFERYIPQQHRNLITQLKRNLLYTC